MVAKDIFPFATRTDVCEETNPVKFPMNSTVLIQLNNYFFQNSIFMGKCYEIHFFATVSHGCEGKIFFATMTYEKKNISMNLAKNSKMHFSFFKVNPQNPKFNLEYLL